MRLRYCIPHSDVKYHQIEHYTPLSVVTLTLRAGSLLLCSDEAKALRTKTWPCCSAFQGATLHIGRLTFTYERRPRSKWRHGAMPTAKKVVIGRNYEHVR